MEAPRKVKGSITVKDVPADKFIATLALHFKNANIIDVPAWADYAKTACFKEHTPLDPDWFYIRAASIARRIYIRQAIGVGTFKDIYGDSVDHGVMPSHHGKASGKIIRMILIQLERKKLLEKIPGKHGLRRVSSTGRERFDKIACQIAAQL